MEKLEAGKAGFFQRIYDGIRNHMTELKQQLKDWNSSGLIKKSLFIFAGSCIFLFLAVCCIFIVARYRKKHQEDYWIESHDPVIQKMSKQLKKQLRITAGKAKVPLREQSSPEEWFQSLPEECQTDLLRQLLEQYECLRFGTGSSDPEQQKNFWRLLTEYQKEWKKKS